MTAFDDIFAAWAPQIKPFIERGLAVAVGLFDASGAMTYANDGMCSLLGGSETSPPSLSYFVLPTFESLASADSSDGVIYHGLLTFGGEGLPHRSVRGQAWRKGDAIFILVEYDVTELEWINREVTLLNDQVTNTQRELARKKAALERALSDLQETQAMLIQSEKMNALGQLVAGVAHEINNPLSFIHSNLHSLQSSMAELLEAYTQLELIVLSEGTPGQKQKAQALRDTADLDFLLEDTKDLLSASLDGMRRIKELVENLRAFSRLDEAEYKEADLRECIASTLTIAQPQLRKQVEVFVELDNLPPVHCYPAALNQVFLNLIINAAQAIDGDGTIIIRGVDRGQYIELTFSDTGRGMSPDVLAKIFDPFFTTKPVGSGTGLGLTIAYQIIRDRHKGTITAESTPGMGSTFTITLPKNKRDPK